MIAIYSLHMYFCESWGSEIFSKLSWGSINVSFNDKYWMYFTRYDLAELHYRVQICHELQQRALFKSWILRDQAKFILDFSQYKWWWNINRFVLNAPFLHPLKTSENCQVFWFLRGREKVHWKKNGSKLSQLQLITTY